MCIYMYINICICACIYIYIYTEKAMAPHCSTLAWRIPGMEEAAGLPSMGSHRVGYD